MIENTYVTLSTKKSEFWEKSKVFYLKRKQDDTFK